MTIYDKMQKIANKLLTQFNQEGMSYIFVLDGAEGRDPGNRTRAIMPLTGVARGVSKKYIDSGLAVAGDYQSTHPVAAFTAMYRPPRPSDLVKIDGIEYSIKQAIRIPPTGTIVAYRLIYGKSQKLN